MSRQQYFPGPPHGGHSSARFPRPQRPHDQFPPYRHQQQYPPNPHQPPPRLQQPVYPQHHQPGLQQQRFPPQQQPFYQPQWFPAEQQQQRHFQPLQQQQQQNLNVQQRQHLRHHQQYRLQHQRQQQQPEPSPFNPSGRAPVRPSSGSGWSAPEPVFVSPASTYSQPRAATQTPCSQVNIGGCGRYAEGDYRNNNITDSENTSFGAGCGNSRASCTSGYVWQQARGDGLPGVQSPVPETHDLGASSLSLPHHQGRETPRQEPPPGSPCLAGQGHAATRDSNRQQQPPQKPQQQQQQQHQHPQQHQKTRYKKKTQQQKDRKRAEGETSPQRDDGENSPGKETTALPRSPKSPEVAEPKNKKAKGKRTNLKDGGKGALEENTEKEKRQNEMLGYVRRKFPNILRQPCIVPPIRIFDKLKCSRLEERSVHKHEVTRQPEIQNATLLGFQTEDTVTRYLAGIISNLKEPVLFLSNYQFDDYLYHLRPKPKGQSNTSATNTKGDRKRESSECAADMSPEASNESQFATRETNADSGSDNAKGKNADSNEAISNSENASRQTDCSQEASDGCEDALRKIFAASNAAGTTTTTTTTPASEASPAAARLFPTPDVRDKQIRGDFDALIVLPKFGFIVVEAKTLLGIEYGEEQPPQCGSTADDDSAAGLPIQEAVERGPEAQDEDFRGTIRKALQKQLKKAEDVLIHLTSDLVKDPPVTKLLAFPNTSVGDLRRLLEGGDLLEECGKILGTRTLEEALSRCITSEHILADSMARETSDGSQSPGEQWLQTLITDIADSRRREVSRSADVSADDSGEVEGDIRAAFSPEVFEEIVARFCGPYSRVPGRTVSDCVHLTGVLYGRSVLREDQLKVLESSQTLLFLMGPPGSGKTLLLGLKAAEWAGQGDQVVVVCNKGVNYGSLVSWTLYDRVKAYIQSVKHRDIKRKAKAAEAAAVAAAAAEEEDGSGRDGDGSGGPGSSGKIAEKKISSSRKQNKHKCPGKPKGRVKSSSSSDCPESPDRTSAELGTPPDRNSNEDGGRQHEQLLSGGPAEPQSPLDHHATRPHDNLRPEDIPVDNVHRVYIDSDTNVEEFVSELLEKYGQGNLRIILDEWPKLLKESCIPDRLAMARSTLNEMVGAYEKMINTFNRRIKEYCNNSGQSQEVSRGELPVDRPQRLDEGTAESRTTTGGEGTSSEHVIHETVSTPTPSLTGCKDTNQDKEKPHRGQRPSERPEAEEEKTQEQKGVSENNADKSTDLLPKPSLEAKKQENSASEPVFSPVNEFKADEYFATMEDRMEKLRNRFQVLSAKMAGKNDEWSRMVADRFETYEELKSLSEQAAGLARGSPECCTAEDVDELENLGVLMVKVMGFMFGVFSALKVLKSNDFLSVLTEVWATRAAPLSPRRNAALGTLSASPRVQSASRIRTAPSAQAEKASQGICPTQEENAARTETASLAESGENMSQEEVTAHVGTEPQAGNAVSQVEVVSRVAGKGLGAEEETVSRADEETVSRANEETVPQAKEETLTQAEEETVSRAKEETASKAKEETASQAKEETASQAKEETASQAKEETASKAKEETASQAKEDTASQAKEETASQAKEETVSQAEEESVLKADESPSAPGVLSVWGTSVYNEYIPPGFDSVFLTDCLRCTPNIQKILKWTEVDLSLPPKYKYITSACDVNPPLFTDGFPVKWFDHAPHSSSCKKINDCRQCGEALVKYLVDDLGVRTKAEHEASRGQRGKKKQDEDSPLFFHDVIICGSPIHQDNCPFIQRLRERGVSVVYENQEFQHPPPFTDNVLVIGGSAVQGLEAKIVVFVPELERVTEAEKAALESSDSSAAEEQKYSEEDRRQRHFLKRLGDWNGEYLWMVASRCLSHLIIFH